MSTSTMAGPGRPGTPERPEAAWRGGLRLLVGVVALMWIVEIVNAIDSNRLDRDGIWPRDVGRLWGILTAPFLHAGFWHLFDNTIPFVFMGVIIALRGAVRLALVSAIVIVIGGLGTWLISPSGAVVVGASGLVFGYATYLLTRGVFDRSALELLTGLVVAVIWGGALIASLLPQTGVSWQGHLCGGAGGVVAAWTLARRREEPVALPALRSGRLPV
jgi:membrane associated rhomboid family serine protease